MSRHSWLIPVDGSSSEQTTDQHFGTAASRTTSPATPLYARVKVPLVPFAAWYPSVQVTAQLKKRNLVQTKSRSARGQQWSTSVLRKWDTEALGRSPRLHRYRKSKQWKLPSLKSLHCRLSNLRCKTLRKLCSGIRDCGRRYECTEVTRRPLA